MIDNLGAGFGAGNGGKGIIERGRGRDRGKGRVGEGKGRWGGEMRQGEGLGKGGDMEMEGL